MLQAIVDTGSAYTLVKESVANRVGEINQRRCPPRLKGVTGTPLRILGMLWAEVQVGHDRTVQKWLPVVPDEYLTVDLLLGCDLLSQERYSIDARRRVMMWGGAPYVVNYLQRQKNQVDRVQLDPSDLFRPEETFQNLNLTKPEKLAPYQTRFVPIKVKQDPGASLIVYPQSHFSHNSHPFLVTVDTEQNVHLPLMNASKTEKTFRVGTVVGSVEPIEITACQSTQDTPQIQNDLLPHNDQASGQGTRTQRLGELVKKQKWQHLTPAQRDELRQLILSHDPLFILDEKELGTIHGPPAHIKVDNPNPSRGRMYRYPERAKQLIADMLTDMEEREIIERSTAAWLSPIVLVNKPDGTKRMCLDYRHVNKHLAADVYPLPRLEELVEQAAGHPYYVTLDMREAYFQVMLDEASRDLTTFSDGVTLYRFRRLPFGLNCSPAIFSRRMASLLTPLLQKGWVKNYLDDLILWAPTFTELIDRLSQLFTLLAENGVKLNLSKCTFGLKEVSFLGNRISEAGSTPDPKNIEAIANTKPPKTVKEVRRFLGMCGFYRRHVPAFAKIATPLTQLTRARTTFHWTESCQRAFETLKDCLVNAPVLVKVQLDQPFILTTDASNTHVGAVLSQPQPDGSNKPVGYFSKKLGSCETRYSATDKEALAIVLACRHFHHYLWGTRFTVVTDHQPLTSVFKRKTKSPRMNRWILEMREYNYEIQYVKGKDNYVADYLSRPVQVVTRDSPQSWLGLNAQQFVERQREDAVWAELVDYLQGGKLPLRKLPKTTLQQFELVEELLYYVREKSDGSLHHSLVVPRSLIVKAVQHAHELSGHLGQKKTITRAEDLFYWPNLKTDVCDFVKKCVTCQRFKGEKGLQQQWKELPAVTKPLERIGIDLTDMVAGNHGFRYSLTVVDHYSRFVRFFPLKTKHTTHVTQALGQYVADYGPPGGIVLDNGGEFTSAEFQQFCHHQHIQLFYTTPYHPQGNGITERLHRTLKSILSALCQGHPLRWPQLLHACETTMNQAVHTTTGQQPFFLFFNRYPPRLVSAQLPSVEGEDEELAAAHALVRETHQRMARKYRSVANRQRKSQSVELNSLVWIRRETPTPGTCKKLNPRWDGVYKVVEVRLNGSVYVVENVFTGRRVQRAAAQVKPYYGDEEWLLEPPSRAFEPAPEDEDIAPWIRRRPRRLIEEC